jgi:thiamine biosynthesis lipoprotein
MSRRPYIAVLFTAVSALACVGQEPRRRTYEHPAMGTTFRLVLFADERDAADAAAGAAFARVDALERRLSDWRPDSEVRRLTDELEATSLNARRAVSADLFAVLAAAERWAVRSDGAFDVTVGPYVRLWRRSMRQGEVPSAERLAAAGRGVGWSRLRLDEHTRAVEVGAADMRIDLGGIAKGYALDQVLLELEARGIESALVDGGGDVAVSAPPPGELSWHVRLDSGASAPSAALSIARGAVATSGDAYRFVDIGGVRYSHLIDPRTGWALTTRTAATVIAPDGMTADALASALCVLGPPAGLALVETLPEVEARMVVVSEDGSCTFDSTGFQTRLRCDAERTLP